MSSPLAALISCPALLPAEHGIVVHTLPVNAEIGRRPTLSVNPVMSDDAHARLTEQILKHDVQAVRQMVMLNRRHIAERSKGRTIVVVKVGEFLDGVEAVEGMLAVKLHDVRI
jgi:hypothetical protein